MNVGKKTLSPLSSLTSLSEEDSSDKVVYKIIRAKKRKGRMFYLVRWEGRGEDEDSYEPYEVVKGTKAHQSYLQGKRASRGSRGAC